MSSFQARLGSVSVGDNQPVAIMGIINLDPHSFYQNSYYTSSKEALSAVERMVAENVDMLDIGGLSTAPGSPIPPVEIEKKRVVGVIQSIVKNWDVPVSIDTYRAPVAQVALEKGATIVNDVSGLKFDPNMGKTIQDAGASCVLMATKNRPGDRTTSTQVISALRRSLHFSQTAGIPSNLIVVDPGLGFGKPFQNDLDLIRNLRKIRILERPILLGVSRKSFIGKILDYPSPQDRLFGTLAAVTIAILKGAHVIRAHDVRATKDCAKMATAIVSNSRM
ncbi:MAG: dihydropteroate synthase [Candidatus Hermodarchaeota archaeon]